MILKALYDYYYNCDNLPTPGMEEKEIAFLIVLSKDGKFLRFEDCRINNNHAKEFLVRKHESRSSAPVANYLYDNCSYVLGYSDKAKTKQAEETNSNDKDLVCFNVFKDKIKSIHNIYPDNEDILAILSFYKNDRDTIISMVKGDPLWEDIVKNLSKKFSTFSFRINGDTKIVAEKKEILQLEVSTNKENTHICLVTGKSGPIVETTTASMIPGSQATAKLVSFQVSSGYDSYGKSKCGNAPISTEAEFAYTTALNRLLRNDSRNKFQVGNRTFVFWASSSTYVSKQAEESLFDLLGYTDNNKFDPNSKIEQVRKVFQSIYSGQLRTNLDDRFYILGLAPNSARIAVVYWSEVPLRDFASMIIRHFEDMEIIDTRKNKKPYMGIKDMLSAVTMNGKLSDVTPNLPEAVAKSIFQGIQYPYTLFSSCIRRIRADISEKDAIYPARVAILKAYINRVNNEFNKIDIMLDKDNSNQGYLCGRLFAVLDKIQEDTYGIHSIRERYMNAASATPASVFSTILNLSAHHLEKFSAEGKKIYYEKFKQEIIDKLPASGFPAHLNLQDQGRFFIGYYHQKQDFYTRKEDKL